MSLITIRRCDVCGRRETDYGAVGTQYAEVGDGRHVCSPVCALVLLATRFKEAVDYAEMTIVDELADAYERVAALRQELVDFMASSAARPKLAIEDVLRKLTEALEGK